MLSIDIDSYDWQVWNALEIYRPKLVIIECNSSIPPGIHSVHKPPISLGASFTALVELGRSKGYSLVCHTGNCFFVTNELVPALEIDPKLLSSPEKLFNKASYRKESILNFLRNNLPEKLMSFIFRLNDLRRR